MNLCRSTVTQAYRAMFVALYVYQLPKLKNLYILSYLHQQKLIPESPCETAPPGDVVQADKCPMVLLISAS